MQYWDAQIILGAEEGLVLSMLLNLLHASFRHFLDQIIIVQSSCKSTVIIIIVILTSHFHQSIFMLRESVIITSCTW